jgi:hypothetical protein
MTIREYFDNMIHDNMTEEDWDEISEYEETLFHCYEDDYDDFCMWAIENGIDVEATETVLGEAVPVLTLWAYDMCGD